MCLILFSYENSPEYSLKLLANRDEFYERPCIPAHWWDDLQIYAGKDLKENGTWLGITKTARFCAVTNIRDPKSFKINAAKSRGKLVTDYLKSESNPEEFIGNLVKDLHHYNDFNLIMTYQKEMYYFSSQEQKLKSIQAGVHGLSNAGLNTPWPKVEKGKMALESLVNRGWNEKEAFEILQDNTESTDDLLPDTGVGISNERLLSPIFIESPIYGTRSSIAMEIKQSGEVKISERDYINDKVSHASFTAKPH